MRRATEKIKGEIFGDRIIAQNCNESRELLKRAIGTISKEILEYSFIEAFYLLEKGLLSIYKTKNELNKEDLIKIALKKDKGFREKYIVYNDLSEKGYIVKSGLKFGAPFRVYEKGKFPLQSTGKNDSHSKWLVYPHKTKQKLDLYGFFSKNRVAHSTKKESVFAFVDEEGNVSYYQTKWLKV